MPSKAWQYRDGDAVRVTSESTRSEFSSHRKYERPLAARKGKIDLSEQNGRFIKQE